MSGVVGLHPTLNGLFDTVWAAGQMAVIPASGIPDSESRSRSHFEMQRFVEYGSANFGVRSGWLTRVITGQSATSPVAGVSTSNGAAPIFRGAQDSFSVPRLSNYGIAGFRNSERAATALAALHEGNGFVNQVGSATLDAAAAIGAVDADAGPAYPNTSLARHLKDVANLLRADIGLVSAIVDSNGWDHHDEQGGSGDSDGRFNRNGRELGDALTAFVTDLGPALNETVYGRDYPDEIVDTNENRRALPVLTDYRQAIDEVLASRVPVTGAFPTLANQPALGIAR